eukprot:750700-Hanusia_phi.AAC.11
MIKRESIESWSPRVDNQQAVVQKSFTSHVNEKDHSEDLDILQTRIIALKKTIDDLKSEKMQEENRRKNAELKAQIYDQEKKFYDDSFDSLLKKLSDIAHNFKTAVL